MLQPSDVPPRLRQPGGPGGDILWAEGFGWADLENRVRVSPDTPFRIGTASKALTAAAVGLLVEQDRLRLDERISCDVRSSNRWA